MTQLQQHLHFSFALFLYNAHPFRNPLIPQFPPAVALQGESDTM